LAVVLDGIIRPKRCGKALALFLELLLPLCSRGAAQEPGAAGCGAVLGFGRAMGPSQVAGGL
jgi:hypothetical protein